MSSKRRIRKQTCGNKIRYETKQEASDHWYHLYKKDGIKMRCYQCKFCKGWHLGSAKKHRL